MEVDSVLRAILQKDRDGWGPLPAWGTFLFRLGRASTKMLPERRSRIIGVSVPTRSYAAAFLGSGIVLASLERDCVARTHVGCEEFLNGLPKGTPIWLRRHNRRLKALYEGPLVHEGVVRYGIRTERGTVRYLRSEECEGIELREAKGTSLPGHQNGLLIQEGKGFLSHALTEPVAGALVNKTRDDCVFVGSVAGLRAELCGQQLGARNEQGSVAAGSFQDIIRVRQFSGKGEGCRSHAFATGARARSPVARSPSAGAVVFDGALGFLRWRDYWAAPMRLVVLDRTDRNWPDAVEVLNHEYVHRRCSDRLALDISGIPAAIEVMAYEVPE